MKVKLRSGHCPLRAVIITGGIGASILFGVVGVALRLQLFGDGSIFCYAVAAQDAWLFHCLRGWRDAKFVRTLGAFCAVLMVWAAAKLTIRPDDYIADVLTAAAFKFIDIRNLVQPAFLSLLAALAGYGSVVALLRWMKMAKPEVFGVAACAAALGIYWIWFDDSLLTSGRYNLRTLMLVMIPTFGVIASVHAMDDVGRHSSPFPFLPSWTTAVEAATNPRVATGALLLIMLIHAVETTKFVLAWSDYKAAVRALATDTTSDPQLGNPFFVSSSRIGAELNRLAWNSTTPYLSVLVAPRFELTRLVVDPDAGYFWLSCKTARQSEATSTAIPAAARRLVRIHACLHR